jgi:hypothetical protein
MWVRPSFSCSERVTSRIALVCACVCREPRVCLRVCRGPRVCVAGRVCVSRAARVCVWCARLPGSKQPKFPSGRGQHPLLPCPAPLSEGHHTRGHVGDHTRIGLPLTTAGGPPSPSVRCAVCCVCLCSLHSALFSMLYALCSLLSALRSLLSALCSLLYALLSGIVPACRRRLCSCVCAPPPTRAHTLTRTHTHTYPRTHTHAHPNRPLPPPRPRRGFRTAIKHSPGGGSSGGAAGHGPSRAASPPLSPGGGSGGARQASVRSEV